MLCCRVLWSSLALALSRCCWLALYKYNWTESKYIKTRAAVTAHHYACIKVVHCVLSLSQHTSLKSIWESAVAVLVKVDSEMKKRTLHDSKAYDSYWNEKLLGWWMLILYTAKVSNNEVGVSSMSQKLGLHRDLNILFSHFFLLLAPLMWSSKALSSGCEHKPLSFLLCGRNSHWRQSWFKVMGIAFWFFFFYLPFTQQPNFSGIGL